jgi:hypothetical protein
MMFESVTLEMVLQYGALGLICVVFICSFSKQIQQMMEMESKIFEYFMKSNSESYESIKNSIISLVQLSNKTNENIINLKRELVDMDLALLEQMKRIKIDEKILESAIEREIKIRKILLEVSNQQNILQELERSIVNQPNE